MSDNQLIIATAQFDLKDWTQLLRNYQNLLSKCKEQRQKSPHEKILHALQTSVLFWLPTAFWSLPVFAMTNRWQNARAQWPQRRMRRHLREYVLLEDDDGRPPRNNFRLPEGCIAGRKSRYGPPSPYCRLEARTWKLSIWQMVTRVFAVVSGLLHSTTNRLQTPENFRRLFGTQRFFHMFSFWWQ